tara:strand:- start:2135 stop:2335 length:201 start_codon:yes stop_codon:yes gene_type:complete
MFKKKKNKELEELQCKVDELSHKIDTLINSILIPVEEEEVLVNVPADIFDKIEDFMKEDVSVMGIS